MDYRHRDNHYIVDIIKKAIKTLNDKNGSKFRLLNATFGIGVDSEYGIEGQLDKTIMVSIEDASNNKYMKLFWYESFFELLRSRIAGRQRRGIWGKQDERPRRQDIAESRLQHLERQALDD